jgi:hypothetical protein
MYCAYISGIVMILKAVLGLKKWGNMAGQQGQPGEFKGPLIHFSIGALLIWFPSTIDISMTSLFGDTTSFASGYNAYGRGSKLLGYLSSNASIATQWAQLADVLINILQFVGLLSFLKGWFILASLANQGGQQHNSVAKGLTHIIGGIFAINFINFITLINTSLLS